MGLIKSTHTYLLGPQSPHFLHTCIICTSANRHRRRRCGNITEFYKTCSPFLMSRCSCGQRPLTTVILFYFIHVVFFTDSNFLTQFRHCSSNSLKTSTHYAPHIIPSLFVWFLNATKITCSKLSQFYHLYHCRPLTDFLICCCCHLELSTTPSISHRQSFLLD